MIVMNQHAEAISTGPGVQLKVLAKGGQLMSVEFTFESGSIGAVHSHPHEQIGYIIEGSFELEMDGKKEVLQAGDSYYVPPNTPHGVVARSAGKIFDVFSPQREDFL